MTVKAGLLKMIRIDLLAKYGILIFSTLIIVLLITFLMGVYPVLTLILLAICLGALNFIWMIVIDWIVSLNNVLYGVCNTDKRE